jgi:hypothetical protein
MGPKPLPFTMTGFGSGSPPGVVMVTGVFVASPIWYSRTDAFRATF